MRECADAERGGRELVHGKPEGRGCKRSHDFPEKKRSGFEGVRAARAERDNRKYLVAMRPGETPVPIPNTMVKPRAADDTALATVWESRRLPDYKKGSPCRRNVRKHLRAYSSAG